MFKALSNPQRLKIFLKLTTFCFSTKCCDSNSESIRRCVGDLGADLGLSDSTISHHIKELRQAGLLHVERCGQKIECWISEEAVELLVAFFGETVNSMKQCKTGECYVGGEQGRDS